MDIDLVVVGRLEVNCYLVSSGEGSDALIIDPGDEFEKIQDAINERGVLPRYVVFTHAHYDHVCAAGDLKSSYNVTLLMHEDEARTYRETIELCMTWGFDREDFPPPDRLLREGDLLDLGQTAFRIIHTPGHTPGGICLYGAGILFTGDTLFPGSVGRTDLPGGDSGRLRESLRKLLILPPETLLKTGHGDETTLAREKGTNPFLRDL